MARTMSDAKLIRITPEAHHAARIGAAIEDMKLEDWASWALVEMSKQARAQGYRAPSAERQQDMLRESRKPIPIHAEKPRKTAANMYIPANKAGRPSTAVASPHRPKKKH